MNDKHPHDDHEDQEIITMLQVTQSPLLPDARRRIWKNALTGTSPHRDYRWVGRLPFALAAFGLIMFVFVLAVRSVTGEPAPAATGTVIQTPAPLVLPPDGILRQYLVYREVEGSQEIYTFVWYQAPNLMRIESYQAGVEVVQDGQESPVVYTAALLKQGVARLPAGADPAKFRLVYLAIYNADHNLHLYGELVEITQIPMFDDPEFRSRSLFRELTPERGQAALDTILQRYSTTDGTAKLVRQETLLGRKVWVIDGYMSVGTYIKPAFTRFWIDQEHLFQMKTERNGVTVNSGEIVQLALNEPFEPTTFNVNMPAEAWSDGFKSTNKPDRYRASLWKYYVTDVPFTMWYITPKGALAEKLLLSMPSFDPFSGKLVVWGYSAADPLGTPVLAYEQYAATVSAAAKPGDENVNRTADGKHIYDRIVAGTRLHITADASVITAEELTTLVDSLSYIPPVPNTVDYVERWKHIAQTSSFAVFAVGLDWVRYDEHGRALSMRTDGAIEYTNLVVGMPAKSASDGVQQRFYFKDKPGIAAVMIQGKYSIDFRSWDSDTTFINETAWYKIEGDRQYLAIIKEGTTIVLEARLADVSKDNLNRLSFALRRVPVPEAGK